MKNTMYKNISTDKFVKIKETLTLKGIHTFKGVVVSDIYILDDGTYWASDYFNRMHTAYKENQCNCHCSKNNIVYGEKPYCGDYYEGKTRCVRDLLIGETAWCIPWGINNGKLDIDVSVSRTTGGTHRMKIKKVCCNAYEILEVK